MKLASLRHGRDGKLLVVSRNLRWAQWANDGIATLQAALDGWDHAAGILERQYKHLNEGEGRDAVPFEPDACASPLPRAFQWADGSAYVRHVELVRKARKAEMPKSFWTDPLMYQGGSDGFLGPHEDILCADEAWGIDFEGEVAAITCDVPMGADEASCARAIRLLMLVNDVSLRNLIPAELEKGFGFFQSKPASAFSPVAVTPDEFGPHWQGGKVCLPLEVTLNGALFGRPNAGVDMTFPLPRLIAHAARTRSLGAGTIIGSGTVSNADPKTGHACIAEKRMVEIIETGAAKTPFMRFGDRVRIDMHLPDGSSVCGAIDQTVRRFEAQS